MLLLAAAQLVDDLLRRACKDNRVRPLPLQVLEGMAAIFGRRLPVVSYAGTSGRSVPVASKT